MTRSVRRLTIMLLLVLAAGCDTLHGPSCVPRRDADGRIARSSVARQEFLRLTGYPKGRPGYVVDHIVPLACCGADTPANMQWQTVAEARAKDRVERQDCGGAR